jgi:predicted DNA-binding protein (UPF0251 family)
MDRKCFQSSYELAPHLTEKPHPHKPQRLFNPRELEIYRLHTTEKLTIREFGNRYDISMKRVWNMHTHTEMQHQRIRGRDRRVFGMPFFGRDNVIYY